MTLSDMMKSDVDDVFLSTDDFAETITRNIGGDESNTETFPGIITWDATRREDGRGQGTARTAEVFVSDSVTVTVKDTLILEGNKTEVTAVGPVQDGARIVYVSQYLPEIRGGRQIRTGDI